MRTRKKVEEQEEEGHEEDSSHSKQKDRRSSGQVVEGKYLSCLNRVFPEEFREELMKDLDI